MAGTIAATAAELAVLLARLDPASLDGEGRATLARARVMAAELVDGLVPTGSPPLQDAESYRRLMELAGPEASGDLLDRLDSDLRNVATGLARGLAEPCVAELRAQTHVLIALAGVVGATALQRLAEALNAAAHQDAFDDMARLGRLTMRQLDALSRFIAAERAEHWRTGATAAGAIPA